MKQLLMYLFIILSASKAISQIKPQRKIPIEKGVEVILRDTSFITRSDTILLLTEDEIEKMRIRESPHLTSSRFYDSLEKRSSARKITQNIFGFVFKKKKRKEKLVSAIVKSEEAFMPYAGHRINSITFRSVDLLEGSVIDTLQRASSRFGKFVNKVHKDTRTKIVEKNLLFEAGDLVDPYTLADNERVLRQFITLRDARIYVAENKMLPNAVDVVVVTQDVASIGVSGDYSSTDKYRLDVYDINILGYARQLQFSYFRNSTYTPHNGFEILVRDPNFLGTFLQGQLQYANNYIRERGGVSLSRDFFTPEIKYAGGMEMYRTKENFYFEDYDTFKISYTENAIDLWAGRSLEFKKRMNIILSARFNTRDFTDKPFVSSDSNSFFYDRTLLLGSISLTKRNFLKSLRIQGFGRTEDIPIGGTITVVSGKELNEFTDRTYIEFNGSFGKYFSKIGYINLSFATGSFIKAGTVEDGLLTVSGTYFSDLSKMRKTQVRQFIYGSYTKGFNRILDRTIRITDKWQDAEDLSPLGNQRLTLGFETVYFMPWFVYGFQFAFFHRFDLNLLSMDALLFTKKSAFPSLRAGVRTLNENLVFPAFAIDLTYYGKNNTYTSAWEFRFSTSLPDLFGTRQAFKPNVTGFD